MTILQSRTLIEPFAGAASVGILHLLAGKFDRLILVELDDRMAACWTAILGDDGEELVDSVRTFEVHLPDSQILISLNEKLEAVTKGSKEYRVIKKELAAYSRTYLAPFEKKMALLQESNLALWTLVKIRCSFGGYLDGGFSVKGLKKKLKDGTINYQGLRSRWNSKNLVAELQKVRSVRSKITFIQGHAFDYLPKYPDAFAFVDPPYTVGGKGPGVGLYRHNHVDHDALFKILSERPGPWMATYNDVPEVMALVKKYGFESEQRAMRNLRANAGYHELMIRPKHHKGGDMIFRYPGGKERLARKLLKDNTIPYADWNGESVYLKDRYNRTAAFWKSLLDREKNLTSSPPTTKSDQEVAA